MSSDIHSFARGDRRSETWSLTLTLKSSSNPKTNPVMAKSTRLHFQ